MTVLIVGASGATGRLLTEQLLERGDTVRIVVRRLDSLSDTIKNHKQLAITQASILELDDTTMIELVRGCDAIALCLGHNPTLKGIFGEPRRLVTDTLKRLCNAAKEIQTEKRIKIVLMNSTAVINKNGAEHVSLIHRWALGLMRLLLPPHVDNENAADFLQNKIGKNDPRIAWAIVRPDSLINEDEVSEYAVHASLTRSPLFNAGKSSRINVSHFMAELIINEETWDLWSGKMPVLYNTELRIPPVSGNK